MAHIAKANEEVGSKLIDAISSIIDKENDIEVIVNYVMEMRISCKEVGEKN